MSARARINITLVFCCCLLLVADSIPLMSLPRFDDDTGALLLPDADHRATHALNDYDPPVFSTDVRRRNVLMPRICYFSRVTATGIHRKLCLPYNDER